MLVCIIEKRLELFFKCNYHIHTCTHKFVHTCMYTYTLIIFFVCRNEITYSSVVMVIGLLFYT